MSLVPVDPRLRLLLLVVEPGPWFQSPWRSLGGIPEGPFVLLEVALQSLRLFMPAPIEVTCLGLLPKMSLAGASPVDVAGSSLFLQRLLAWA